MGAIPDYEQAISIINEQDKEIVRLGDAMHGIAPCGHEWKFVDRRGDEFEECIKCELDRSEADNKALLEALRACHLQMLQSNNQSEYAEKAHQLALAAIAQATKANAPEEDQ